MNARTFAVIAPLVLVATPALAAPIPQLDPTWFASQLFWLTVSFAILLLVVLVQINPTMRKVLDTRDDTIKGALKEAELLRASAEAAKSSFAHVGADTRAEASAMIAKTLASITAQLTSEQAKLDATLATTLADAERATKAATQKALSEAALPTAELVQAIAGAILGKDITSGDAQSAVKKVA
ncbi:MAG: hypothetical protein ACOYJ2_04100 [Rickettsiales bacterium]